MTSVTNQLDITSSFWMYEWKKSLLDDDKQPEEYEQIKVDETYDYLPLGNCLIYDVYFCI